MIKEIRKELKKNKNRKHVVTVWLQNHQYILIFSKTVVFFFLHLLLRSACITECTGKSEDKLRELVPSFHQVGPQDQIQIAKYSNKYFYSISHFTNPKSLCLNKCTAELMMYRCMYTIMITM